MEDGRDYDPLNKFPEIKLPHLTLPSVRDLPSLPHVGCVPGIPTMSVERQRGSDTDLAALQQIRVLKKSITEQIGTLIEGKLPDFPRAALYEVRQARLVIELAAAVAKGVEIAMQLTSDLNANIDFINSKIAVLNEGKDAYLSIPQHARTKLQQHKIDRNNEYIGELNGQKSKIQSVISCITSV